jgi:hypothetical protein
MSIQLASTGKMDEYTIGKPSISYFSSVYKRHTPFIKKTYEFTFDQSFECIIPQYGDIITNITLKTILPALAAPASLNTFYWTNPGVPVSIHANYNMFITDQLETVNGSPLIATVTFSSPTLTTDFISPVTLGNYKDFNSVLHPLFVANYNTTSFTWTINCPPLTQGLTTIPLLQYNLNNTTVTQLNGPVPSGIIFNDRNSANFFGFPQINTIYSFDSKGNVSGDVIQKYGWIYGNGTTIAYPDSLGYTIINEARLMVGGQIISRITGNYLKIKTDMSVNYENQVALTQLVGKGDSTSVVFPRQYMATLDFGIKNLPLCSLKQQSITVQVDFAKTCTSSLLVEYAVVSNREMDWFVYSRQSIVFDYLIYQNFTLKKGINGLNLSFKFPIKELYITTSTNVLTTFVLLFNGQEYINYTSDYFQIIEPFENKVVMPTYNVYLLTFKEPINFSRISDILLNITSTSATTCTIYANCLNVFVAENNLGSLLFTS